MKGSRSGFVSAWKRSNGAGRKARLMFPIREKSDSFTSSEKNSHSPQNLENKGPEFFLPRRSMVLKVVTGKILETLELWWYSTPRVPCWDCGNTRLGFRLQDD